MPHYPNIADRVSKIEGAAFEKFRDKMIKQGEQLVRLHIGDTYMEPSYPIPLDAKFLSENKGYNRYCDTYGINELRRVLADKLQTDNHLPVNINNILMTCGATNALSATVQSLVNKGEEILVLTPCWPLFFGIANSAEAKIKEAPFYTTLFENPDLDIYNHLSQYISQNTKILYLNTPNNPSGKVLNRAQLEQIARFVKDNNLWLISDEAYDGLTFDNLEHFSIASLPGMFERTITVFTFSKIFMFAGLRLGYAVAEKDVINNFNKILVYQVYSPPTFTQQMMIEPVQTRHEWMGAIRKQYQNLRDLFIEKLHVPFNKPEATYFIFLSVEKFLHNKSYDEFINACFDSGVSVSPGGDFGKDFSDYIRLCFTGETPERLERGIERLNKIFS